MTNLSHGEDKKNNDFTHKNQQKKHLIFELNDNHYGIPLSRAKEVVELSKITPIPKSSEYISGVLNLRGQLITIIDLRLLLDFPPDDSDRPNRSIILTFYGEKIIGAIVDEVIQVLSIHQDQLDDIDDLSEGQSHNGVYGALKRKDQKLTLLIDIEKALTNVGFEVIENPEI